MYHLKLVGRQILQRKGYFVINTIGLAVALTASVFIYTFLVKEWQTNTFHENVDHITGSRFKPTGIPTGGQRFAARWERLLKRNCRKWLTIPESSRHGK